MYFLSLDWVEAMSKDMAVLVMGRTTSIRKSRGELEHSF